MVVNNTTGDSFAQFKNNVAVIGGSSGLGVELCNGLRSDYNIYSLSSKDLNLKDRPSLYQFFADHNIGNVINLAGYNYDCFLHRYDSSNFNELDNQIDVVVRGGVNLLNACLPKMRLNKYGRIICISSILASKPVVGTSVYAASKCFLEGLVKACAVENASKGVTANALQIGYFDGGLTHLIPGDIKNKILDDLPLKRWGELAELESIIRLLLINQYINGITLKANGGAEF